MVKKQEKEKSTKKELLKKEEITTKEVAEDPIEKSPENGNDQQDVSVNEKLAEEDIKGFLNDNKNEEVEGNSTTKRAAIFFLLVALVIVILSFNVPNETDTSSTEQNNKGNTIVATMNGKNIYAKDISLDEASVSAEAILEYARSEAFTQHMNEKGISEISEEEALTNLEKFFETNDWDEAAEMAGTSADSLKKQIKFFARLDKLRVELFGSQHLELVEPEMPEGIDFNENENNPLVEEYEEKLNTYNSEMQKYEQEWNNYINEFFSKKVELTIYTLKLGQ